MIGIHRKDRLNRTILIAVLFEMIIRSETNKTLRETRYHRGFEFLVGERERETKQLRGWEIEHFT